MKNRFLTHFATILALHGFLIFGWTQLFSDQSISLPSKGAMKVRVSVVEVPQLQERRQIPKKSAASKQALAPKASSKVETPVTTASTGASKDVQTNVRSHYHAELKERIEQNKYYPVISRRLGQTGRVIVGFTLLNDGSIINVHLHESCPFEHLNDSALNAVKKVGKFRPIPKELGEDEMSIQVPIEYRNI